LLRLSPEGVPGAASRCLLERFGGEGVEWGMKVLLVVNPQKAASGVLARQIQKELAKKDIETAAFSYTDKTLPGDNFDIAFSLGGDGTVLFTARLVNPLKIPVLPVNLGRLGFISAVPCESWQSVFGDFLEGRAKVSERIMLHVKVRRRNRIIFELPALNDAVISASGIAKTIRLNVLDDSGALASYRSDGLIAATPTGSTAYSCSAGGPILDPGMEALILNPICPFTFIRKPLVLPLDKTFRVQIEKEQRSGVLLTIDGQVTKALESSDEVLLSKDENKIRLIGSGESAFYKAVQTKLSLLPQDTFGPGEEYA